MQITREMLLENVDEIAIHSAEMVAKLMLQNNEWVVSSFDKAPAVLTKLCNWNGGDEDWMAIISKEPDYLPYWVECLDSCHEPDVYLLNGIVIYVGNHA